MKHVATSMALLMLIQSGTAFAQNANRPGPGLIGGIAPVITPVPGQFDIKQTDTSEYVRDLLKHMKDVQASDIKFIEETVTALNKATNDYTRLLTVGAFKQLSDASASGLTTQDGTVNSGKIKAEKFLEIQNLVNETRIALNTKLEMLTSISGALPSDLVIGEGRTNQAVATPRRIDFSKTIAAVKSAVDAAEALAKNYPFVIEHVAGIQIVNRGSGTALTVVLNFPLLTGQAIAELQKKAKVLSTPSATFDDQLTESHANILKKMIAQFVHAYGESETYRFRDQNFAAARAQALENIVDAFWTRSYLRKVQGVRVGTILPQYYKKRYANIDRFTVMLDQLKTFKEASGPTQVSDSDLIQAVEDIRQTLIVLDERSSKILSGDASVLARVNSTITFLRGKRPSAEALLLIMQLIAADLKEEQELATGGGVSAVMRMYDQRWLATEEDGKKVDARVCAYDHLYNVQEGKQNCYMGGASSGIRGVFTSMNDELNRMSADLEQAMAIRKQIQLAMLAQSMNKEGAGNGSSSRRGR